MKPPTAAAVIETQRHIQFLRWLTPDNIAAIRADLTDCLRDDQPAAAPWSYPPVDLEAADSAVTAALRANDPDPNFVHFRKYLTSVRTGINVLRSGDEQQFSRWSTQHFGLPSPETAALAEDILAQPAPRGPADAEVDAQKMAAAVRRALDAYDLSTWRVEVTDALTVRMSVQPSHRLVRVNADLAVTSRERDRLLLHEIGTHVLRATNAENQPAITAAQVPMDGTATEEGLAAWHEQSWHLADEITRRRYAARTLAVITAQSSGVLDVVRTLQPLVGADEAVSIAIRVKRGLRDPNQPGGLTKDHAYLTGVHQVADVIAADPDAYLPLMSTKWPLSLLPLSREMLRDGRLTAPVRLPDREKLGVGG